MEDSSSEPSREILLKDCRKKLSLATDSLKIATVIIFIILILHIVGFSLPNWYQIVSYQPIYGSRNSENESDFTYLVGLWEDCFCVNVEDVDECTCVTKSGFSGFLRGVQILETVGLVGWILSAIICFLLVFFRQQDRVIKGLNLVIAICSGTCAIAAVILFERENVGLEYKEDFSYLVSISPDDSDYGTPDVRSNLTTSFILCTTAAGLSLFYISLLLIDLCNQTMPVQDEMQLIHVVNIPDVPFTTLEIQSRNASTQNQLLN